MSKAAPDVDLKSQSGVSGHLVAAGVAIVCATYVYSRTASSSGASDELVEDQEIKATWLSWIVWLLFRIGQIVLGGFVMMLALLVVQQRKILYVPVPPGTQRSTKDNPGMFQSPTRWGLPYEDLMITTSDNVRVNAWFIYQPLSRCKDVEPYTFVYFHGNAGNIGHRLENIRDMYEKLKINILIVDYRGYGDSEDGDGPSQRGFMLDAHAAYRWLMDRAANPPEPQVTKVSADRVLLFGRSIGGAVAICLMADLLRERVRNGPENSLPLPAGMVLENTFTALRDMAMELFPFLSFVSVLLRPPLVFDPWDSTDSLDFLTKNHRDWACCLLSGLEDQIVPPAQMRQLRNILHERKPEVLKYFTFKHGGHNDTPTRGGAEYWTSFQKFMLLVAESEQRRAQGGSAASGQDGVDGLPDNE